MVKLKSLYTRKQKGGRKEIIDSYKYLLSSYVYSDAKHDFSNINGYDFYSAFKSHIQEGIPQSPFDEFKEDKLLNTIKIKSINDKPVDIDFSVDKVMDMYLQNNNMLILDLAMNNLIKRKYIIHCINYQIDDDMIVNPDNFEHYFGGLRTFVIDFFTMKFFDGFKNNNTTEYYDKNNPYYILYNREMENDPGKKAQLENKHYLQTGYYLESVNDIDTEDIVYSKWIEKPILYKNMFYSTNTFTLKNVNHEFILNIDTKYGEIDDFNPKLGNSKKNLCEKVIKKEINPELAFLKKRSGDSLEALSVLDNKRKLSNNDAHQYLKMLITHDRLLLYYSLLLGIDVGFTLIRNKKIDSNISKHYCLLTFLDRCGI